MQAVDQEVARLAERSRKAALTAAKLRAIDALLWGEKQTRSRGMLAADTNDLAPRLTPKYPGCLPPLDWFVARQHLVAVLSSITMMLSMTHHGRACSLGAYFITGSVLAMYAKGHLSYFLLRRCQLLLEDASFVLKLDHAVELGLTGQHISHCLCVLP